MNIELTEKKKFIDHIKSNFKLIASILTVLILILVYFIGSNYFDKEKRIKISEDFIKAKILIESKNNNEALELLINIIFLASLMQTLYKHTQIVAVLSLWFQNWD